MNESRTLLIAAQVRDFMSKNLTAMGRAVRAFTAVAGRAFRGLLSLFRPLNVAFAGFASAWLAFKGGKTVLELLDGIDALNKLGDSLGTTVDKMVLLDTAFRLNGGTAEQFVGAMRSLGKAVSGVLDKETIKLVEGFAQLGVTFEELKRLDAVEVMDQLAAGLERFGTAQERSAALSRIFPKSFQALFATLANGREEFRKLIETAQLFVGTVSEDAAAAADRFGDAIFLLKETIGSIGRDTFVELARQLAPTIERIATFLATNRKQIAEGLASLIQAVVRLIGTVGTALLRLLALITDGVDKLIDILREIPLIGGLIGDAMEAAFDAPKLTEQQRQIRDAATETANTLVRVQASIERMVALPAGEVGEARLAKAREQAQALQDELSELGAKFDETFAAGRPPNVRPLEDTAKQAASLRQLADFMRQLASGDIGSAPGNLPLMQRLLWGDESPEEAEDEVNDFFAGFSKGINDTINEWRDFRRAGAEAARTLLDGGLDGIVEAMGSIIDGTKSAREAFRDFARQLLSDLARIISKLLVMQALNAILGLAKGGVVPGGVEETVPVKRFAKGGVAHRPTLAVFGEGNRSEAFVPLPDNRSIPVTFTGGGGQGTTIVNFHITAMDGKDVRRVLVEQQHTLRAIWENQAATRMGMRQAIQRTA